MLKIWGRSNSINVQKVMWLVTELQLPHTRTDAGLQFGTVNEEWYRAMNPNGRVPTIDDEGFILWESNAVVRYIAGKHAAGSWWPQDMQVRADADRWMDWCTTTIAPVMTPLFWGLIRTPVEKRDPVALEAHRKEMDRLAGVLDARLADGRAWLCGDTPTMGDIPIGCFVYRWYGLPIERAEWPHLRDWYERLAARPAFREHVMLPLT
ncbi:MAG: glutathione S-transferase [Betaproteobacteria bacterium]|nr:glutathione S-transferase [Betaproteobacteria bacterium]